MTDLKEQIKLHKDWLLDNTEGKRLDLRYANLKYADLSGVDLSCADLSCVDLRYANLKYADLKYADLRYANLSGADLSDANLRYANLSGANLSNANLRYCADLRYCIGNNKEVKSLQLGKYLVSYTKDILNIGCQSHRHSSWKSFNTNDILSMDRETALDWWNLNKHIIFELIDREQNENN